MKIDAMTEGWATKSAKDFVKHLCQPPLLHGDEEHKKWLSDELEKCVPELADVIIEAFKEGYNVGYDTALVDNYID